MKLLDLILENQILFNLLSEDGRLGVLKTKFVDSGLIKQNLFDEIVDADPTRNKTYTQWLLNQYVKQVIKPFKDGSSQGVRRSPEQSRAERVFIEDLEGTKDSLIIFDAHKKKFPKADINQYSISEFNADALDVEQKLSDREKSIAQGQHKFSADEEKYPELQIGKVDGFTVWKFPQGRDDLESAAVDLSGFTKTPKDTNWCTGFRSFKGYNRKDPLYIFIGKGRKYQFHYGDNEFKNEKNLDMSEGPRKDAFLKFIEDHEGRVTSKTDLTRYMAGGYDTPDGRLPIYKIGKNRYYGSRGNEQFFYDPDTGLLKTQTGKTINDPGIIFTHPYMDFLKEVYRRLKEEGDTKGFRGIYRLLLGLDVPEKGPGEWWSIPGGLDLSGSELTELPDALHIGGDLDLTDSKIKKLPARIKVDGEVIGLD